MSRTRRHSRAQITSGYCRAISQIANLPVGLVGSPQLRSRVPPNAHLAPISARKSSPDLTLSESAGASCLPLRSREESRVGHRKSRRLVRCSHPGWATSLEQIVAPILTAAAGFPEGNVPLLVVAVGREISYSETNRL